MHVFLHEKGKNESSEREKKGFVGTAVKGCYVLVEVKSV